MLGISTIFFRGYLLFELNLIFIYFPSSSSEFLVTDLIKPLILLHSSSYFYISSFLSWLGTSVKYLFLLIYTINFYIFRIFYCYISNIKIKLTFAWLFIYFNFIGIKIFGIDNTIKKLVCAVFYNYAFITNFWFILLIHNFF